MNSKPAKQLRLSYGGDDSYALANRTEHPVERGLLERILSGDNLRRALRQVERNKGCAGVDGMKVGKLRSHLKQHWSEIREAIVNGAYRPSPVLRKEIPKPGGGMRKLGIPTVVDRFIQHLLSSVCPVICTSTLAIR